MDRLDRENKVKGLHPICLIHPVIGASIINVLSYNLNKPVAGIFLIFAGFAAVFISAYPSSRTIEESSGKLLASIKYWNNKFEKK